MGGPNVQKEEVTSQATPLAEDFLKLLQGQLSSGAFGTGVGPLQREAGTALRQFISSLQGGGAGGFEAPGGVSAGAGRLIEGLTAESQARTERGAADLREQGGITGTRFGSSLAQGEALFRSEAGAELNQLIGGIQEGQRQFDVSTAEGARQFDLGTLLQGISQLFGQGQANLQPFQQFSALGILPEEVIVGPSTPTQIVTGATGILDAVVPG